MSDQPSGVVFLQRVNAKKVKLSRLLRRNQTAAETMLWEQLRDRRFMGLKFRRQQVIEGFVADFFCHEAKLVVEVDGAVHDLEHQKKHDEHRRTVFALRGLCEIRFRNSQVANEMPSVLNKIAEAVRGRLTANHHGTPAAPEPAHPDSSADTPLP